MWCSRGGPDPYLPPPPLDPRMDVDVEEYTDRILNTSAVRNIGTNKIQTPYSIDWYNVKFWQDNNREAYQ